MFQSLDALPDGERGFAVLSYINATSSIQIARITNISNWYFERVVFPGQRLIFEAPLEAKLEIHTGMMASAILSDTIPCTRLRIENQTVDQAQQQRDLQQLEYRNELSAVEAQDPPSGIPPHLIKDLELEAKDINEKPIMGRTS
ncbi:DUF1830 domain-containing protein [Lyngbya confervoides]|uniref:DUF1830 domain-containing protein n=1 Tax=Lyngbya confervoides BDU141951 TaxID=1574623 RepID=A0ABD4TB52_9CYAN|nr:DUF1830 domain-containing protein [Lyngbya confervoides]MCM1985287.1 DUF1830 domain-containing protein [Lyngbya confervoides BDU141951]